MDEVERWHPIVSGRCVFFCSRILPRNYHRRKIINGNKGQIATGAPCLANIFSIIQKQLMDSYYLPFFIGTYSLETQPNVKLYFVLYNSVHKGLPDMTPSAHSEGAGKEQKGPTSARCQLIQTESLAPLRSDHDFMDKTDESYHRRRDRYLLSRNLNAADPYKADNVPRNCAPYYLLLETNSNFETFNDYSKGVQHRRNILLTLFKSSEV